MEIKTNAEFEVSPTNCLRTSSDKDSQKKDLKGLYLEHLRLFHEEMIERSETQSSKLREIKAR